MQISKSFGEASLLGILMLVLALGLIMSGQQERQLEDAYRPTKYAGAGFSAAYEAESGRWSWQYERTMPDGCTQLLLRDTDRIAVDQKTIVITMKTYRSGEVCTQVSENKTVKGRIAFDADAQFSVVLDDVRVFPLQHSDKLD